MQPDPTHLHPCSSLSFLQMPQLLPPKSRGLAQVAGPGGNVADHPPTSSPFQGVVGLESHRILSNKHLNRARTKQEALGESVACIASQRIRRIVIEVAAKHLLQKCVAGRQHGASSCMPGTKGCCVWRAGGSRERLAEVGAEGLL